MANARIPRFRTLDMLRGRLADGDFVIDTADGAVTSTPSFTSETASALDFPLLGFSDVDVFIARVELTVGSSFFSHFHPRATEVLIVTRGTLRSMLQFEGVADPRVVMNVLSVGEATIFPQGLIHSVTCIEADDACEYMSVLTSADPGIVAV
ncbi:Rhicadhesin receptor precursor [Gracilaria domingensis]|nr:Rhicadhesin receptor precursor [Gracilaria domingensis]